MAVREAVCQLAVGGNLYLRTETRGTTDYTKCQDEHDGYCVRIGLMTRRFERTLLILFRSRGSWSLYPSLHQPP